MSGLLSPWIAVLAALVVLGVALAFRRRPEPRFEDRTPTDGD